MLRNEYQLLNSQIAMYLHQKAHHQFYVPSVTSISDLIVLW